MRKLSKILTVMVLSLLCAFSFGAAAVFAAPAEEKTLDVKYATLKFEDNVYILYAVESENIADTTAIKLLVWESVPAEYTLENAPDYTLNYYNVQNIEGTDYPVFCFNQLSAKQMTDEVYVCAYYDDGGAPVYSAPLKYSILQYAVNKLYDVESPPKNLIIC